MIQSHPLTLTFSSLTLPNQDHLHVHMLLYSLPLEFLVFPVDLIGDFAFFHVSFNIQSTNFH